MTDEQTDVAATLVGKIAAAMNEAGEVTKSEENREQGYKFASAEAMLKAVRGPLFERGVILTPELGDVVEQEITARSGSKGTRVIVHITFRFADGETELAFNWRGEGQDYGDKAYGKAYTNAIKTFIRTAWLLPTEHDDPEKDRPTERATAAGADAPAWTRPASDARLRELGEALMPVLGRDRTAGVVSTVRGTLDGVFPDGFVALAKLLGRTYSEALGELNYLEDVLAERNVHDAQAAKDAAERRRAEEAQAAAEAADPPAPDEAPSTGPAGDHSEGRAAGEDTLDQAHRELAEQESGYAPAPAEATGPPMPGSVAAPAIDGLDAERAAAAYRAAGCTCKDPGAAQMFEALTARGNTEQAANMRPLIDENCPIAGHGIGF